MIYKTTALEMVRNVDPFLMSLAFRKGHAIDEMMVTPMTEEVFADICLKEAAIYAEIEGATRDRAAVTKQKVACAAGCHFCCFQTFEPSTVEIIAIACYLRAEASGAVRVRAAELSERINSLTKPQRYAARIPCVALDGGKCSIYPVRPRVCRTYYSISRVSCERDFKLRGEPPRGKKRAVPLLAEPGIVGAVVGFGVDLAFFRHGFEVDKVEMAAGLHRVLEDPDKSIAAWFAGESVFADIPRPRSSLTQESYPDLLLGIARQYDTREARLAS